MVADFEQGPTCPSVPSLGLGPRLSSCTSPLSSQLPPSFICFHGHLNSPKLPGPCLRPL